MESEEEDNQHPYTNAISFLDFNSQTFITLNGRRLRFDEPLFVSYSLKIYITKYINQFLFLPSTAINEVKFMFRPALAYNPVIENYQRDSSVSIFWYDINATFSANEDVRKTHELLRRNVESVSFYTSKQELYANVYATRTDSRIFLVISGKDAEDVLKDIHEPKQIDTVFIFCRHVADYTHLKECKQKVAGIFNTHATLQRCISSNLRRLNQQQDALCLYAQGNSFMCAHSPIFAWKKLIYDKMATSCLVQNGHTDMINHCHALYRDNKAVLKEIFKFECSFTSNLDVMIWYTKTGFLYESLNRALRSGNFEAVFIFRSFISELSSQLIRLHSDFCLILNNDPYTVYRGVRASMQEIDQLQSNVGGLVGATQYLSTTPTRSLAEIFAGINSAPKTGEVSILYEIQIDPRIDNKDSICANISRWNYVGETEILFNVGCIFEVIEVKCTSTDRNVWHVTLKSSKVDMNEAPYYRYLKQQVDELDRMRSDIALGRLMVDLGVCNHVQTYLNECLRFTTYKDRCSDHDANQAFIYDTLGRLYILKKQPYMAIAYFTWAFSQFQATHQPVEANKVLQSLLKLTSELLNPWQLLSVCKKDLIPLDIYADACFRLGKSKEARKMYIELIQTLYTSDPIDHFRLGEYMTRLGEIYRRHCVFSLALEHLRMILPEQHPFVLNVIDHLNSTNDIADNDLPWFEISIVHQRRHTIRKLIVQRSDTIGDIKESLQCHFGLPYNTQTLQMEGGYVLANNSATVDEYDLQNGTRLYLTIDPEPGPRRISVENEMNIIEVADVYWWQSIYDIKRYLYEQSKLPPPEQQRLFEAGRELSNNFFCGKLKYPTTRLLLALRKCELNIKSEKLLSFFVCLPLSTRGPQWKKPIIDHNHNTYSSNFTQDVFEFDGNSIRFVDISCEITVADVKTTISKYCGIPIQYQRLTLEAAELTQNAATLISYGIHQSSILELELINIPRQLVFRIRNAHNTDQLEINSNETIEGLKNHISKKMRVSPERINLSVSGDKLSPGHHSILKIFQTNQHLDDLYEVTVDVTVCKDGREVYYGVAELASSDRTETYKINLNDCPISFDQLQTLVFNATHIPIHHQRLYADGQLLCSGQKLNSNSIKRLFVLHKGYRDFTVTISVSRHPLLRLFLREMTTAREIKQMIKYLRRVSVKKQRLFVGRTELSDLNEIIKTRTSGRRIDVVRAGEKITFVRYKKRWIRSTSTIKVVRMSRPISSHS
jgi:tetratricopeptide (TPR) repeat protein